MYSSICPSFIQQFYRSRHSPRPGDAHIPEERQVLMRVRISTDLYLVSTAENRRDMHMIVFMPLQNSCEVLARYGWIFCSENHASVVGGPAAGGCTSATEGAFQQEALHTFQVFNFSLYLL